MKIHSDENLTLFARSNDGHIVNKISIGNSKLRAISNDFSIIGQNGQLLFKVDDKKTTIATDTLKVDSK